LRLPFKIVFILLVLILLVASALFGLLTYWLGAEACKAPVSEQGGKEPEHVPRDGLRGSVACSCPVAWHKPVTPAFSFVSTKGRVMAWE